MAGRSSSRRRMPSSWRPSAPRSKPRCPRRRRRRQRLSRMGVRRPAGARKRGSRDYGRDEIAQVRSAVMQYEIEVAGRRRQVVVTREGDAFAVTVDGATKHVNVKRIDGNTLSLIVDSVWPTDITLAP